MHSFTQFVYCASQENLNQFFQFFPGYFDTVDWDQPVNILIKTLQVRIKTLPPFVRSRVQNSIDRVCQMTDVYAQKHFLSSVANNHVLQSLSSSLDRSIWVFINEPDTFTQVESICYSNRYRHGKFWSRYKVTANQLLNVNNQKLLCKFSKKLSEIIGVNERRIVIYCFERFAGVDESDKNKVFQFDIYLPDLPDTNLIFHDKRRICSQKTSLVSEYSLIYSSENNTVEVVAETDRMRQIVVELFSDIFLKNKSILPIQFSLEPLLNKKPFSWDCEDGIKSVSVSKMSFSDNQLYSRLHIDFHDMDKESINNHISQKKINLKTSTLTKAVLNINFEAGTSLPITISLPNKFDLRNRTLQEQEIGFKYLKRWGFYNEAA